MSHFLHTLAQAINVEPDRINVPQGDLSESIVTNALQIFFGIAAAVAVLIIAISAFRLVISNGDPQAVKKARDAIIYAVIGLIITMSGFIIVTFVVERIAT